MNEIQGLCDSNGCQLVLVSNRSEEAEYFARNYGGIAAFLRYEFDSACLKDEYMDE